MTMHFDEQETIDPQKREEALFANLVKTLDSIKRDTKGWAKRLEGVEASQITSRAELAKIPVLRKPELMEAQALNPPFGGFVNESALKGTRLFMSPGPVWEPQGLGADPWKAARSLFAAGFRPGDLVHNVLAYTQTPGGFIMDEGARALGCNVFPAGPGGSEAQVEAASILKPNAYAGTPDFLKVILDKADEMGKDISSITKAMVSGGALFPSMRQEYHERGVQVMQSFATADIGVIAYETKTADGLCEGMVVNEDMILEIVRPGTDDPVEEGEVGEIVVTNFHDTYPLIRFGTGDMTALIPTQSECGRTNMRIKGWMGRADQRTKIKGMFVDPKQVDKIVKSVPGIERARMVVERDGSSDAMTLQYVAESGVSAEEVEAAIKTVTNLRGKAVGVADLPNDGKVIDDKRDYEA